MPSNDYGRAIDIVAQTDQSTFRCLFRQGFTVAFIRVYQPSGDGGPDNNCIANIHNAINGIYSNDIRKISSDSLINELIKYN